MIRHTDGTFSVSNFHWDAKRQKYCCPAGKRLRVRERHFANRDTRTTKANGIIPMKGLYC
jgi:hypothetical protein